MSSLLSRFFKSHMAKEHSYSYDLCHTYKFFLLQMLNSNMVMFVLCGHTFKVARFEMGPSKVKKDSLLEIST